MEWYDEEAWRSILFARSFLVIWINQLGRLAENFYCGLLRGLTVSYWRSDRQRREGGVEAGVHIYGAYGMCSRIVALVLSVTLHILTVKNLYRVVNSSLALSNAFRSWFMAFWYHGNVQQERDIGFPCHAPYTNS